MSVITYQELVGNEFHVTRKFQLIGVALVVIISICKTGEMHAILELFAHVKQKQPIFLVHSPISESIFLSNLPFYFRELMSHENVTFNENGTITATPVHPLVWAPELSNGRREDDLLILPNVALLVSD